MLNVKYRMLRKCILDLVVEIATETISKTFCASHKNLNRAPFEVNLRQLFQTPMSKSRPNLEPKILLTQFRKFKKNPGPAKCAIYITHFEVLLFDGKKQQQQQQLR